VLRIDLGHPESVRSGSVRTITSDTAVTSDTADTVITAGTSATAVTVILLLQVTACHSQLLLTLLRRAPFMAITVETIFVDMIF
jgi:hypothetical protein